MAKGKKPKTLPYRVHDNPDPTKLETLREFVVKFGYKMKTDGTKGALAKSLNTLMSRARVSASRTSYRPWRCAP